MSNSRHQVAEQAIDPRSLGLGILVYVMWGFFPLYFNILGPASSLEVIVHRAFWGLVACLLVIGVFNRWHQLAALTRNRTITGRLSLAGLLIVINWTVYVYAVQSGHTVDAALGYFINPLVTVGLARLVLKERLTPAQGIAIALGACSVVVMIIGLGSLPWVSLVLPLSFGLYSLVKKDVATQVPPLEGMAVETATATPLLAAYYAFLVINRQTSFQALSVNPTDGPHWVVHLLLLMGAGVITLIPLLIFARASRGLPLAVMGLLQYIGPVLAMFIGVVVFKETMEPARWIATATIWVALLLLSADWVRQLWRQKEHLTL